MAKWIMIAIVVVFFTMFFLTAGGAKAESVLIWSENNETWTMDCTVKKKTVEYEGCGMATTYKGLKNKYGQPWDLQFYTAHMSGGRLLVKFGLERGMIWPPGEVNIKLQWGDLGESEFTLKPHPDPKLSNQRGSVYKNDPVFWQFLRKAKEFKLTVNGVDRGWYKLDNSADAIKRITRKHNELNILNSPNYIERNGDYRVDTF